MAVMWGSLYQFLPVVAGAPVRAGGAARVALIGWALGVALLAGGLLADHPDALRLAVVPLTVALAAFVAPVVTALARTSQKGPTVDGLRLAMAMLLLVAGLGLYMAAARAGYWPGPRALRVQVHVAAALLGWVGTLIAAVSWQVVPMFYNAPPPPPRYARGWLAAVGLGVGSAAGALFACDAGLLGSDTATWVAAIAALPAAAAVWVVHPVYTLRALSKRRRRAYDPSLWFWRGAAASSLLAAVLVVGAWFTGDPRAQVAFGWVAILGAAGFTVHGMLGKIVPFLVWFHRFSPVAAQVVVPSMRDLWPDRAVEVGFGLHTFAIVAGLVAALTGEAVAVAGLSAAAVGVWIAALLVRVLTQWPGHVARPVEALEAAGR
jgi:hypothetical protein